MMTVSSLLANIKWLGHAGFLLGEKPCIYIDPYKLAFPDIGDLILITHNHPRHCDPDEVKWLRKGSTIIVVPQSCASQFHGDIRVVSPGDVLQVKGVSIEILPAYSKINPRHSKETGGVGYIITMPDYLRVYHTGDTSLIPEMIEGMADIVLIPIDKDSCMTVEQAAEAVNIMKPKIAIPMHWQPNKDGMAMAECFCSLCNSQVEILRISK